jgi:hypothetical protein
MSPFDCVISPPFRPVQSPLLPSPFLPRLARPPPPPTNTSLAHLSSCPVLSVGLFLSLSFCFFFLVLFRIWFSHLTGSVSALRWGDSLVKTGGGSTGSPDPFSLSPKPPQALTQPLVLASRCRFVQRLSSFSFFSFFFFSCSAGGWWLVPLTVCPPLRYLLPSHALTTTTTASADPALCHRMFVPGLLSVCRYLAIYIHLSLPPLARCLLIGIASLSEVYATALALLPCPSLSSPPLLTPLSHKKTHKNEAEPTKTTTKRRCKKK